MIRPNKIRIQIIAFGLFAFGIAGRAEASKYGLIPEESFPSAHTYFNTLIADPSELGYGGRLIYPMAGDRYGEVMIGDYVGIVRWVFDQSVKVQLNLGGGAISRFNLTTAQNHLDVIDFTGAAPLDIHFLDRHTIRVGAWHTSSHLGDDLIRTDAPMLRKRSMDSVKAIYSYLWRNELRLYGGGGTAVNTLNIKGYGFLQGGAEYTSPFIWDHRAQWFLAQDLQSWERVNWNPSYSISTGLKFCDQRNIASARLFLEYYTGHEYFLQFNERKESHWSFGLTFDIGNPVKEHE